MKRPVPAVLLALLALLLLAGCGGGDEPEPDEVQGATCPADDPDCGEGDGSGDSDTEALPSAVALGDPSDPDAPLAISFGGFLYSDGETSQLCSSLAESFPPQCGDVVIEIAAPVDVVLEHVAEAFGSPDDARINIDQGVYWTDNWVNLTGTLEANKLVLEG